jgi:hypothetical protein
MSSNQPLPGNTPIAAENFNNGDWSARALEAVRIAIECEDVPEDTEYRAQANSDGREASASPHSDRSSSKREEPPVAWASGLIAPARDRLSFPAIGAGASPGFFLSSTCGGIRVGVGCRSWVLWTSASQPSLRLFPSQFHHFRLCP